MMPGVVLDGSPLDADHPKSRVTLPRCFPPFALLGAEHLRHLRFEHLLQRRPHQRPQKLLVCTHKGFDVNRPRFTLSPGHGVHPRQRIR